MGRYRDSFRIGLSALGAAALLSGCAAVAPETGFGAQPNFKQDEKTQVVRYTASNGVRILSIIPGVYGASVPQERPVKDVFCAFAEAVRSVDITLVNVTVLGQSNGRTSYSFERRDPGQEAGLILDLNEPPPRSVSELGRGCP